MIAANTNHAVDRTEYVQRAPPRLRAAGAVWQLRVGVLSHPDRRPQEPVMAKARAKKATAPPEPQPTEQPKANDPLSPEKVHALFGIHGPYEPPPPPIPTKSYVTFWDPGCSIQTMAKKHRALFYLKDFSERFAKDTDSWKWRMIRLTPIEAGLTFAEQETKLATGDKPAAARELVTFLVLHFLTTGERLEIDRWRCADVMPSGRRVVVGPFHELGLDIANVADAWKSPGIALSAICTPVTRKK
jgi:hypothetical protein